MQKALLAGILDDKLMAELGGTMRAGRDAGRLEPHPLATPVNPARAEPPATPAITLPVNPPKRKAGRPRIHAERLLTGREKAARYRQKHKALAAKALAGDLDATGMSHKDLCLSVARLLNQRDNLELRQTGYPLVKELQRRLKTW